MLFKRIYVKKNERVIVTRNGRFASLLIPGVHCFFTWTLASVATESHDLSDPAFHSRWEGYLLRERPDLVAAHFIMVETKESEIAMVYVAGTLSQVLLPGKRALFWKCGVPVSAELVTIIESELPEQMLTALEG